MILVLFIYCRGRACYWSYSHNMTEGCVILALFTHDRGLLILVLFRDIKGLCDTGSVHT